MAVPGGIGSAFVSVGLRRRLRLAGALATGLLLAGCIGGDPLFQVEVRNDSSEAYVLVVQSGLSRWGYQVPARANAQIGAQSWDPDLLQRWTATL